MKFSTYTKMFATVEKFYLRFTVAESFIEVPGILTFKNLLSYLQVMGGSSTINYMVYALDNPTDFDEWVEEGNHGWNYEVPSHFVKS